MLKLFRSGGFLLSLVYCVGLQSAFAMKVEDLFYQQRDLFSNIRAGNTAEVRKILELGPSWINPNQWSTESRPLVVAAENGYLEIVDLLIQAGANVNLQDYAGETALIAAVRDGHLDIVNRLLESGADVNATNQKGYTALMMAAHWGRLDIVNRLLEAGADVNLRGPGEGNTALIAAAGRVEVVRDLEYRSFDFSRAKEAGHLDIVNRLLEAGADVNLRGLDDNTPLIVAAANENLEIVDLLLRARADVNAANDEGYTALMFSAQWGHLEIVSKLLEAGANVNYPGVDGGPALIFAAQFGHLEIVNRLLGAGADVNLWGDPFGETALLVAAQFGHLEIVNRLLEAGADVNHQETYGGYTALLFAADNGRLDIVNRLLEAGADLNSQLEKGDTALILAAEAGYTDTVEALIRAGANRNIVNDNGQTALSLAVAKGHEEIAAMIEDPRGIGPTRVRAMFAARRIVQAERGRTGLQAKIEAHQMYPREMSALFPFNPGPISGRIGFQCAYEDQSLAFTKALLNHCRNIFVGTEEKNYLGLKARYHETLDALETLQE